MKSLDLGLENESLGFGLGIKSRAFKDFSGSFMILRFWFWRRAEILN